MFSVPTYAVCCFSLRGCVLDVFSKRGSNCLTHWQVPVVFCTCWKLQMWKVSKRRGNVSDDAEKRAERESNKAVTGWNFSTWAPLNTFNSWLLGCSCVCVSPSSGGCFSSCDFELRKIWAHENKTWENNCEIPLVKILHIKIYRV